MSLAFRLLSGLLAVGSLALTGTISQALVTYDLRFADGSKTKVDPGLGNYNVKLYAVIDRGDNTFTNDFIRGGLLNIYSKQAGPGYAQPGTNSGVTGRAAISTTTSSPGFHPDLRLATQDDSSGDLQRDTNGKASPNSTSAIYDSDGILDWGADERYLTSGGGASATNPFLANYFVAGSQISAKTNAYNYRFTKEFIPGTIFDDGVSQPSTVRANSWEVLIGQFTISINGSVGPGQTSFTPFSYHLNRVKSTSPSATGGTNYSQDSNISTMNPGGVNMPFLPNSFSGVTFVGIPEPSTYLLVSFAALGAGWGMYRRQVRNQNAVSVQS